MRGSEERITLACEALTFSCACCTHSEKSVPWQIYCIKAYEERTFQNAGLILHHVCDGARTHRRVLRRHTHIFSALLSLVLVLLSLLLSALLSLFGCVRCLCHPLIQCLIKSLISLIQSLIECLIKSLRLCQVRGNA